MRVISPMLNRLDYTRDAQIDVVTLSEALEQHSRLETVGGLNYLAEIARQALE